ncbi:MAG TPA: carboxypeptidase-like regulatory domain-containing protein [Planctomycetota bacterium]|nr:carboxypeptidase-like regulatory domain-containing protein [Planctomycetota bacterium]
MKRRWIFLLVIVVVVALLVSRHDESPRPVEEFSAESPPLPLSRTVARREDDVQDLTTPDASTARTLVAEEALPLAGEAAHEGIRLYGFVRAGNGEEALVPAVNIVVTDSLGQVVRATVDKHCAYSITGLAPGRHWIVCGAGGWGNMQRTIELEAAQRDRRLDLQLEFGFDLSVEVVDLAGNSISGAPLKAAATRTAPERWLEKGSLRIGTWSSQSAFSEVLGRLHFEHPEPLYVSLLHGDRVIATEQVDGAKTRVRFAIDRFDPLLQKANVRLRLVDAESREPLPNVRLFLHGETNVGPGQTDGAGMLTQDAAPGWVILIVDHPVYAACNFEARVEPGTTNDLGDIALEKGISLSLRVVDERGLDVTGTVEARALGTRLSDPWRGTSNESKLSEDRAFSLRGLSRCRYRVIFRPQDGGPSRAFGLDLRFAVPEDLRFTYVRGTPVVVTTANEDWKQISFDVIDAQGFELVSSGLTGPEPQTIMLAPGSYEVEVRVSGAVVGPRRVLNVGSERVGLSLP